MRWVEQFAFLHPIWLVLAAVAYFLVSLLATSVTMSRPEIIPALAVLGMALPLLWMAGLRAVARRALGMAAWDLWSLAYGAIPLLLLGFATIFMTAPAIGAVAMVGVMIAWFISVLLTARALATYQSGAGATALTIGTALLLVYYVIGAWVMRPVVRQLKAAVDDPAS